MTTCDCDTCTAGDWTNPAAAHAHIEALEANIKKLQLPDGWSLWSPAALRERDRAEQRKGATLALRRAIDELEDAPTPIRRYLDYRRAHIDAGGQP